jgi:hypothetical protein
MLILQVWCISFSDIVADDLMGATDYVKIVRSNASNPCYSELGRVGGVQLLGLNLACFPAGRDGYLEIHLGVHQLMHALGGILASFTCNAFPTGFVHEQNRPDRDDHIEVNQENLKDGLDGNFVKRRWPDKIVGDWNSDQQLTPYDRTSVLHYK